MKGHLFCSLLWVAVSSNISFASQSSPQQIKTHGETSLEQNEAQLNQGFARGRLIVRFDSPFLAAETCRKSQGAWTLGRCLSPDLNIYLVQFHEERDVWLEREKLNTTNGVLYAMEDALVFPRQTPNDPLYSTQATHHNTGQSGGVPDADIDAPEAWDIATGSDAYVIAVIDSGGQTDHSDLLANRWENSAEVFGSPGIDDDNNGYVDDMYGWNADTHNGTIPVSNHGTRVAGIMGARGNNGLGGTGVVWETDLMYISLGPPQFFYSEVAEAFTYARTQKVLWGLSNGQKGANIVVANASWGVSEDCESAPYYLWNDMFNLVGQVGILTVGATIGGNSDIDMTSDVPSGCTSDWLITTTSTNLSDVLDGSYGANSIDLAAPGTGVVAPIIGDNYDTTSATSWAAPIVSGAVALMHDAASPAFKADYIADPSGSALKIKTMLIESVDELASLDGVTVSGGRLNLRRALQSISSYGPLGTQFCTPAQTNSSGGNASLSALGNYYVAENEMMLKASNMPAQQFGYFLVGSSAASIAITGSQGILCIGGNIGRYNRTGQIQATGTSGDFELVIDPSQLPTVPSLAVMPGETWHFQAWFRDQNPTSTSNFTDGLMIQFL